MVAEPRHAKHALLTFVAVGVVVALVVRIDVEIPGIGHLGSALVAITMLYAPVLLGKLRGEDLFDYGFRSDPLRKNLAIGLGIPLVVFPLFVVAYLAFYEIICGTESLRVLAPGGMCARWAGWDQLGWPILDWGLAEFVLVQLIVVALPEELLFRGCILGLLERAIPPKRRLWGGGIGWALVISSVLFAVIHLPKDGDPRALATFFPGLLFGWMRSKTGSILAPTIAHAGSNILIRILDQMVLS